MADRGLKVAVLTIDPAKRLANSLGLPELGNEETRVPVELESGGELWALMLDAKRTWDELIERHASDEQARDAVLSNRIYQELSNAVAGSTEYMAMEKLYELYQEDRYDLLVLDTPPTRNALDFLDAPQRLSRFIDSRSLQFFLKPGRLGLRVLGRGGGIFFSVLKRVTGVDLLRDLSDFFTSFGDMAAGFQERAERVADLMRDGRNTTFFVVTSPQRDSIDEAIFFRRRLRESRMPFGGVDRQPRPRPGADRGRRRTSGTTSTRCSATSSARKVARQLRGLPAAGRARREVDRAAAPRGGRRRRGARAAPRRRRARPRRPAGDERPPVRGRRGHGRRLTARRSVRRERGVQDRRGHGRRVVPGRGVAAAVAARPAALPAPRGTRARRLARSAAAAAARGRPRPSSPARRSPRRPLNESRRRASSAESHSGRVRDVARRPDGVVGGHPLRAGRRPGSAAACARSRSRRCAARCRRSAPRRASSPAGTRR